MSDETPTKQLSPAAERMRLSRLRRRKGLRSVPIEIRNSEIEALIAASLLDHVARNDPAAIGAALNKLLDRLSPEQWSARPADDNRVSLKLACGFIEHLAILGWLPPNSRRDAAAVKAGLVGFTERAYALSRETTARFRAEAT